MPWEGHGYSGLRTRPGSLALSLTGYAIHDASPKLLKLRDNVKITVITNTTRRTKGQTVQRHPQTLSKLCISVTSVLTMLRRHVQTSVRPQQPQCFE